MIRTRRYSYEITSCFQVLKEFLDIAEEEVRLLTSLYTESVSYLYSLGDMQFETHDPVLILILLFTGKKCRFLVPLLR